MRGARWLMFELMFKLTCKLMCKLDQLVASLFVVAALAAPASLAAGRYAVIVGHNRGGDDEARLELADDDAERMAEVLIAVGGFAAGDVVVLKDDADTPDDVRRAIGSMNERARAAPPADDGAPSMLLVYYSGHADAVALHLGPRDLPLADVASLVRGSAAAFRVLIVDACRSGTLTHVKGASGGVGGSEGEGDGDGPVHAEGYVALTAATAGEAAQESRDISGSFFTHYLVSGLRGAADADDDGLVSLAEAYRYAYDETVRASSATVAGVQHPTFHYELRGKGDVTLATLTQARSARLVVPDGVDALVFDGDRAVAEVSAQGVRRALALPPGRYTLRARTARALFEGDVDVEPERTTIARLDDLERYEYARLVRKGGEADAQWTPFVAVRARAPIDLPAFLGGAGAGVDGGVLVESPSMTLRLRAALTGAAEAWQRRTAIYGGQCLTCGDAALAPALHLTLAAQLGRSVDLSVVTLTGGVGVGVDAVLAPDGPLLPVGPLVELGGAVIVDVGPVPLLFGVDVRTALHVVGAGGELGVSPSTTLEPMIGAGWRF